MYRLRSRAIAVVVLIGMGTVLNNCGGGGTAADQSKSPSDASTISVTINPANATVNASKAKQFTATVSGSSNTAVSWSVDNVPAGNSAVGTISTAGLYTAPAQAGSHKIVATSVADPSKTAAAKVTVVGTGSSAAGVFTQRYDNARTGLNPHETVLTPTNVNNGSFGKIKSYQVDGYVYTQPLYVPHVNVPGKGVFNVIYVATEHDGVFAFDADAQYPGPLWSRSFIDPGAGVTTVPTADVDSTIFPEIGITSTPVIDPATGTLYVVPLTKESGNYVQRLHALDIATGDEKFGGPVAIQATVEGDGNGNDGSGHIAFQPKIELQRASLLLSKGVVYIAWASHGDHGPYHGWVMGYDPSTLKQVANWNVTPTGGGGSIWQAGCGLIADNDGNIYAVTSNGDFDADSGGPNYSDSIVKLTKTNSGLQAVDFFTPYNQLLLATDDLDLGSAGLLLIPGTSLATTAGKEGSIYVVDVRNMGHYHHSDNDEVVQFLPYAIGHGAEDNNFSTAAYFNGFVYYIGQNDPVRQFQLVSGKLTTSPVAVSGNTFNIQGAAPTVSANGTSNGILWAIERIPGGNGVLHAYDATNVARELYNSNQAGGRDVFGTAVKFTVPTVFNGKVYIGAQRSLIIFGLLH